MKFIVFQGPFEVMDGDNVEARLEQLLEEKSIYATAIRIDPDEDGDPFGFTVSRPVINTPYPVESL